MGCCKYQKIEKVDPIKVQAQSSTIDFDLNTLDEEKFSDISLSSINSSHYISATLKHQNSTRKRFLSTLAYKVPLFRSDFENAFLISTTVSLQNSGIEGEISGIKEFFT